MFDIVIIIFYQFLFLVTYSLVLKVEFNNDAIENLRAHWYGCNSILIWIIYPHLLSHEFKLNYHIIFSLSFCFQMFLSRLLCLSALFLLLVPLIISLPAHDVYKRNTFLDIDCKGEFVFSIISRASKSLLSKRFFFICILGAFNKSIFFRLDRICEDCYSLFREVELHTLCKWVSCVTSPKYLSYFTPMNLSIAKTDRSLSTSSI